MPNTLRSHRDIHCASVIQKDGDWFIGFCSEVPEANGQGHTVMDCQKNLAEAIDLILLDKWVDAGGVEAS